ncbi:hypothetical protein KTO58_12680 [Chitinophaga pendula]|uniref:lipopolysaccharide biosynthesis protein n=1 Tax=Chitinophaga TaxID=79328 RepID=UPI000BAF860C|nr:MULTISPECIES: hypothetical protein [Chitinophaga]ASZ12390.1 hypothetical protein CK934_16205 [Chitinophaga sp. MD30]UCJ10012.1 hypothetical protein KTO58_12680 [Chitinophaga pendula]
MIKALKGSSFKNYSYSFVGNFLSSFSQWVIFSLIAKKYGTGSMGVFSLAQAWILPLFAFFTFQLRNMHVSDQEDQYGLPVMFTTRIIGDALFLLIVIFIGLFFYQSSVGIFVSLGVAKFFEMISDIIHAEFQKQKKHFIYGRRLTVRSILSIALAALSFQFIQSFELALLSLPLAYFISLVMDFYYLKKEIGHLDIFSGNKTLLRQMLITGGITGLSLLLVYLLPNIPRFLLEKYAGSHELGLFAGYFYLIIFSRIFIQSIVQNSLPSLAAYLSKGEKGKFMRLVRKELLFVLVLGLMQFILVPISDFVFPLLYNKDFTGNKTLLTIIFAGSVFSFLAFSLNNVLNAMKYFRMQFPVYLALVLFCLGCGYLLISRSGVEGAAYTFLLTSIMQCILLLIPIYFGLKRTRPVKEAAIKEPVLVEQ